MKTRQARSNRTGNRHFGDQTTPAFAKSRKNMILMVFCGALGVLEVRIGCSDKMVSFAERSPRGKCFTIRRLPKPFWELYFPFCMALIMANSFESSLHFVIADRHIDTNNMAALKLLVAPPDTWRWPKSEYRPIHAVRT